MGKKILNKDLIYFIDWPGRIDSGVIYKIRDQVKVWKQNGLKIKIVLLTRHRISEHMFEVSIQNFVYKNRLQRLYLRSCIPFKFILDKDIIIYRRYGLFSPIEILTIRKIKTVIEINTNLEKYFLNKGILFFIWHKIQLVFIKSTVQQIFTVTNQLTKKYESIFKRVQTVPNGIQMPSKIPVKSKKRNRIFCFLISSNYYWNGINRFHEIIKQFPEFKFVIIGLADISIYSPNMRHHEYVSGAKLDQLLRKCDFGISTLGGDSVNLVETSPLKNRRYLINNLPILGTGSDSGIPFKSKLFFQLRFDVYDQIINKKEMLDFIKYWDYRNISKSNLVSINVDKLEKRRIYELGKITKADA